MNEPYLAIAAIVKNEARRLPEWVSFHRAVGVEEFYIYDNGSTDGTPELLAELGIDAYRWPGECQQLYAYANALWHHEARWIAFLDADEFLFSPSYLPLPTVLRRYEQFEAVGACWAVFGTSGITRPRGSLVADYSQRAAVGNAIHRHVKSIVQPKLLDPQTPQDPHHFQGAATVDELGRPLVGPFARSVTWLHLRVNHYISRSIEEAEHKMTLRRADTGELRGIDLCSEEFNAEFDEVIDPYAAIVRAMMRHE